MAKTVFDVLTNNIDEQISSAQRISDPGGAPKGLRRV